MKRGKKPFSEPRAEIHARIPESLALEVRLRMVDAMRGKVRYASISTLIESLLREWLQRYQPLEGELNDDRNAQP